MRTSSKAAAYASGAFSVHAASVEQYASSSIAACSAQHVAWRQSFIQTGRTFLPVLVDCATVSLCIAQFRPVRSSVANFLSGRWVLLALVCACQQTVRWFEHAVVVVMRLLTAADDIGKYFA